jgi:hypothetical protein
MVTSPTLLLDQLAQREHVLIAGTTSGGQTMSELPSKLDAIRAATRALTAAHVAHALIGGLAVGIRSGIPRATKALRDQADIALLEEDGSGEDEGW